MEKTRTYSESGFTLIELLVACAIIGVLCGLAIEAYNVYKQNAYHAVAMQMMQQSRTSLALGQVYSESFPKAMMVVDQKTPGPVTDGDASQLVPGLTLPENFHVIVRHDPTCEDAACVEDAIVCRHCSSSKQVIYIRTHGMGEIIEYNAGAGGAC